MLRTWIKKVSIPLLTLAMMFAGCENAAEMRLLGPSGASEALVQQTSGNEYVIARQTDLTVGTVSAVIGAAGGKLALGQHTLVVPANAVSAPTTFTLAKVDPDELRMELTATRLLPNDVGSAGFAVPVELTVSYSNAASIPDESKLQLLWIRPDGTFEAQPSLIEVQGKRVRGKLNHFSEYGIGWPNLTQTVTSTVGGLLY